MLDCLSGPALFQNNNLKHFKFKKKNTKQNKIDSLYTLYEPNLPQVKHF